MVKFDTATLGFGRMGPNRELKFALEKYWKGSLTTAELLAIANEVEDMAWKLQSDAGIDTITVGDYCLYDNVASWAEYLGIIPKRFAHLDSGIDRMFAMCRGVDGATALSMKKWITSNYHYMVPEIDEMTTDLKTDLSPYLAAVARGVSKLGTKAAAVVLGPVSMVRFCCFKFDGAIDIQRFSLLEKLLPIYSRLLADIAATGVSEIQIHEPALVFAETSLTPLFRRAYCSDASIIAKTNNVNLNIVSFFDDVGEENYKLLTQETRFNIVSLDFTRGNNKSIVQKFGFPDEKTLGAGLIDGRSVWKVDPVKVYATLKELELACGKARLRLQPSSSLQFVPWDLSCEKALLELPVGPVLAFSTQKLAELFSIAECDEKFIADCKTKWAAYRDVVAGDQAVLKRLAAVTEKDLERSLPFVERRKQQLYDLPLLPTTTIGSFPQTKEIRSLRNQYKRNKITKEEYERQIDQQIAFMIGIQEALDLDILVHGEPERTDMVEYFGQQLSGVVFTENGWVQSFGSRCVRPPIFWSDISRPNPMTVREYQVAAALTKRPVKAMLTGPVTILNWSFPRVDISRKDQCMQIALALRDEIADLEAAGCKIIQVDEPALREAMPLRPAEKAEYLQWTVDSFKFATAGASPGCSIHTHMCYCEFEDCMEAIDRMDTDVNSIENARSDNATLLAFKDIGYNKGLGPGTYDIHSPVVPPVSFIEGKIRVFLECIDQDNLVVNPDCGLKTRAWPETLEALKNMVEATKKIRREIQARSE